MEKILKVQIKSQYGLTRVYPICEDAKIFCKMLKQETFTQADIDFLKALGYKFELVQEEPKIKL